MHLLLLINIKQSGIIGSRLLYVYFEINNSIIFRLVQLDIIYTMLPYRLQHIIYTCKSLFLHYMLAT